jgi:hypothetical protein
MHPRQTWIAILSVIIAVAIAIIAIVVLFPVHFTSVDNPTPIGHIFWMQPETPGTSGSHWWYNFTVTVNRSIPSVAFGLGFVNVQGDTVPPPPTFSFTVYNGSTPIAAFNLTTGIWTQGASQELERGDWFGVQLFSIMELNGAKLVALGETDYNLSIGEQYYSSTTSAVFL